MRYYQLIINSPEVLTHQKKATIKSSIANFCKILRKYKFSFQPIVIKCLIFYYCYTIMEIKCTIKTAIAKSKF